jgi:(p)ppGpp synthase/HD superfamily hydrolase
MMDQKNDYEKDIELIERAKQRATEAHKGVMRQCSKEPFVSHPIRVALAVSEYVSAEAIAAAYLHDVIEDTHMSIDDFPDYTKVLVDDLTKRDGESKREAVQRLSSAGHPEAIIIKLADRIDNLVDGKGFGKKWMRGYLKGARQIADATKHNGLGAHPLAVLLGLTIEELQKWAYSNAK